ncbi:MAG TPA: M48 family metalloprotease [Planctomycetota bacterium]|nr:M48 family metalloprotease [Planctomycetota bacterium]
MAYLIHIGLALLAQAVWEETSPETTPRLWLVVLLCLVPHALGAIAHRLYLRGMFRSADRFFALLSWSPVALHALAVFNGGWLVLLEGWTAHPMRLMGWPTLWSALSFAPFVVYSLLGIDARSRLGSGSTLRSRTARRFQMRLFLASLSPMLAYMLVSAAVGAIEPLRLRIETVSAWSAAYAAAMLLVFAVSVPWLLRNSWETEPMPEGVERSLLESVSQLANFDGHRLFIWRTGNTVANAAIIGLFPRHRVVLFSDLLLSQLDLRQLASVFAHEIGHAKKNHVLIFGAWALAALFGADLLATAIAPDDLTWNSVVLIGSMAIWVIGFGWMSRRFELEADIYSLRLIGDPAPLIGALEEVSGPHGRARTSWRHFSTQRRIEFLEAMTRDPGVAQRLERRLTWVARTGFVAFLIVAGIESFGLARAWPEQQVMLDLRQGAYAHAAQRIESRPRVDSDLANLTRRAATLRQGDMSELEAAARSALARGDLEAFSEWLYLGALRGNDDMDRVGGLLSLWKSKPAPEADDLLALCPPAWREALGPLLREPPR